MSMAIIVKLNQGVSHEEDRNVGCRVPRGTGGLRHRRERGGMPHQDRRPRASLGAGRGRRRRGHARGDVDCRGRYQRRWRSPRLRHQGGHRRYRRPSRKGVGHHGEADHPGRRGRGRWRLSQLGRRRFEGRRRQPQNPRGLRRDLERHDHRRQAKVHLPHRALELLGVRHPVEGGASGSERQEGRAPHREHRLRHSGRRGDRQGSGERRRRFGDLQRRYRHPGLRRHRRSA